MTTTQPVGTSAQTAPSSLRTRLSELQARGQQPLNLKQAVGVVVPVAVEVAEVHRAGHRLFLHPSCLVEDEYGFYHVEPALSQTPPSDPRDAACIAPELQFSSLGGPRASVYAIGAIIYELLTGESVGPGMRRPSELVPGIPEQLEIVLAKALVAHPERRPDDLNALAQALYQLAPAGSVAPPPADTSHLDHHGDFEVDVSLSILPPVPRQAAKPAVAQAQVVQAQSPYDVAVRATAPESGSVDHQTEQLAALKRRLEADRTPRYVVIKDGMDHGPFAGVELLQQIANHTFEPDDVIRDSVANTEIAIKDSPEFSHFAKHAKIHREIKEEKAAIERVAVKESRSTRSKALLGILLVGALAAAGGVWFLTQRGAKSDEIEVQGEVAANVESDTSLEVKKGARAGGRVVGTKGGFPVLGGGMSCEAARAAYTEQMTMGAKGQADITGQQYGNVLNRGSYFAHCGVPDSMKLNICAAVQNGRAVGVTVTTSPRDNRIAACVAGGVRRLSFPSHPKLDVTRTSF